MIRRDITTLRTLLVNKPSDKSRLSIVSHFIQAGLFVAMTLYLLYIAISSFFIVSMPVSGSLFFLSCVLILCFLSLLYIDHYLRFHHATETISIQGGSLVIEYQGSLLRKKKVIPLSSIRRVKAFSNYNGEELIILDKLKVVYGHGRRYRFGANLSERRRTMLAKQITEIANKHTAIICSK